MGGPRASVIRQREAGKMCCNCHILLSPPPPWHKPGFWTGERYCDNCAPRILLHVQYGNPFVISFTDGPWLLFATISEVKAVFAWAHADAPEFDRDMDRWGRACGEAKLTETQRFQLAIRRRGWPWNGYELLQMWHAGKYPPARLTPQAERVFLANRRKNR